MAVVNNKPGANTPVPVVCACRDGWVNAGCKEHGLKTRVVHSSRDLRYKEDRGERIRKTWDLARLDRALDAPRYGGLWKGFRAWS